MKKQILQTIVGAMLLVPLVGCEPQTLAIVGAAGLTAEQLASSAQEKLQANITAINAKNIELERILAETDDTIGRVNIQAAIDDNNRLVANMRLTDQGIDVGRVGVKTNWKDPAAVAGFVALLMSAVGNYMQSKQTAKAQAKYQAHKQGVERTFLTAITGENKGIVHDIEGQVYENIGEARRANGVV